MIRRVKKIQRQCLFCKKFFEVYPSDLKRRDCVFCSLQCMTKNNIGSTPWNKGKKCPQLSIGKSGKMAGRKNPRWKGGRRIDSQGYVLIYRPEHPFAMERKKYVYEHRLAVERAIGRFLKTEETIRHVDGVKINNKISNLIAFSSEAVHQKFHHGEKIAKAEILFDGREYDCTNEIHC